MPGCTALRQAARISGPIERRVLGPFVVLLGQDRADQADDGGAAGEDRQLRRCGGAPVRPRPCPQGSSEVASSAQPCGAASRAIRYPRMHRHRGIRGDVAVGVRSCALACHAASQDLATRWRVWRLEDAAKPGIGDTSSAQHGDPWFPRRLRAGILELLARRAARGRQMGMAGQGMMPDQAAAPEPFDQFLHGGRVRDLLKKRAQHLAQRPAPHPGPRVQWPPGSAMHGLDPVPSTRDLDMPSCAMAATAASATRCGPPHRYATWYTSSSLASDVTGSTCLRSAFQRQPRRDPFNTRIPPAARHRARRPVALSGGLPEQAQRVVRPSSLSMLRRSRLVGRPVPRSRTAVGMAVSRDGGGGLWSM